MRTFPFFLYSFTMSSRSLPCVSLGTFRESRRLSQVEVKRRMAHYGVVVRGSGTISNIESGKGASRQMLDAYALAVGLHPADIHLLPITGPDVTEDAASDAA